MEKYSRVAKNAILGDGILRVNKTTAAITYISTDLKLLAHKEMLLHSEGLEITVKKTQASGYGGTKTIHVYATTAGEKVKEASDVGVEALIQDLTKEDIYLWYLDDGSWHKHRHTMHLYSNELDNERSMLLIKRIEELYGIAPALRIDRKKDGRQFYYLYFPRDLVRIIRPEIEAYILDNGIDSMMYKVGGADYKDKEQSRSLTDNQVRTLRREYAQGELSVSKAAKKLNVSVGIIYAMLQGKSYKDVV